MTATLTDAATARFFARLNPERPAPDEYAVKCRRTHGRWVQHRQHSWSIDRFTHLADAAADAINDFTRCKMRETSVFRSILTADLAPGAAGPAYCWSEGPNGSRQCFAVPKLSNAVLTKATAAILNARTYMYLKTLKGVGLGDAGWCWVLATHDRYQGTKIRELLVKRSYQLTLTVMFPQKPFIGKTYVLEDSTMTIPKDPEQP